MIRFPRKRSVRNRVPLSVVIQEARQEGYNIGLAQGEAIGRQAACDDLMAYMKQQGKSPDSFELEDVEEIRVRQLH